MTAPILARLKRLAAERELQTRETMFDEERKLRMRAEAALQAVHDMER